jgi:chromate reductase
VSSERPVRILGIAGSLREGSYNRALLRAAIRSAPPGSVIKPFDLRGIPVYDEDLRVAEPPERVVALKQAIADADALLFCTPEYNNSIPGVLKNAIDWASRPPQDSPFGDKPVGLMGASDGPWGTVRAQQHLRLVLAAVGAIAMVRPIVFLPHAARLMDETGALVDPEALTRVAGLVEALVAWTRRLGRAEAVAHR